MADSSETELQPLSDKEKLFVEDYLTNGFNKAEAARKAKYSENCDRQIGWQVYNKPHVKAYIENILKERIISSAENQKLISDTAQSNLTDYYRPVPKVKYQKIKVGLQVLIDRIQEEHDLEAAIADELNLTEEQQDQLFAEQQHRLAKIIRYKVELRRNPNATRIIDSEPEIVEEMELDINALVADKEKGKVKSIAYTPTGLKVEMYSAADAQDKIAKMHGDYAKDNEQKVPVINTGKLSDEDLAMVIALSKKASANNS